MTSEWKTYKIKDVLSYVVDNRGKTPPIQDEGFELLEVNAISATEKFPQYQVVRKHVSEYVYNTWFRSGHPQIGDILVPTVGTLGAVSYVNKDNCCIAQNLIALRANKDICDCDYLYYILRNPNTRKRLLNLNIGGVQPSIKVPHLMDLEIEIPPVEIQKKIVSILRVLDDRISINQKTNDNLQQQLATIYKSWYQDFSLAADSDFVETKYGMIPNGWHYAMLGDLCQSVSVTHKFNKEKLIFLNTGDVEDGRFLHSEYMAVKKMPGQAKKTIALGDILYSEIRPINRHFAYVNIPSDDYVVSTKLMVIRSNGIDSRRLYHYLTLNDILSNLQHQAESRSGTFPQIRFENVSRLPILIADEQTESKFIDILNSVYNQTDHLNIENKKLAELRDAMLPKLMAGKFDVSDIKL